MTFASHYDEDSFHHGPPALFSPDPRGNLRIDPERTREMWLLVPEASGHEAAVYVLTDRASGVKMVLATNCPALVLALPRAAAKRVADYASARSETMEQWSEAAAERTVGGPTHEP